MPDGIRKEKQMEENKHTLYEAPALTVIRFTGRDITTGASEVPEEGELIPAGGNPVT